MYNSPLARDRGNGFYYNLNQIHLVGGPQGQRRGLFYEEVRHAIDYHEGAYAPGLTDLQLHAVTARKVSENPLLPTTLEQNKALLELAEKWKK